MDATELQKLAERTRSMREIGIALVFASGILALILFIQFSNQKIPDTQALTTVPPAIPDAFAQLPAIEANAAIVYDVATGETLYAKNADAQLPLASLTKLLTVYAALAELSPGTPITIPESAVSVDEPRVFSVGQTFSLSDLARLTLTASLNDGAVAIAEATATRENRDQTSMLAGAAASLGLLQTYAVNGSGLDVSEYISGGYGSARDLALLSGALVEKASAIALATTERTAEAISLGGTHFSVKNTNLIVGNIPRLLLSKTGFTDLAGGNLALVFDAGMNHPVAVVVLGSTMKSRFTDAMALVAATLAHYAGAPSL